MRRLITASRLFRRASAFIVLLLVCTTVTVALLAPPSYAHTPHDTISDVAASPAYSQDHTLLAISDNHLLRSTDGGAHWIEATRGLGQITHDTESGDADQTTVSKVLGQFAFAPSDPRVVYLSSRGAGVFKSTDRGTTWTSTRTPAAMAKVTALAVSPTSPDVVIATVEPFGVYRTVDGGSTWTGNSQFVKINELTFVPGRANRLVAAAAQGAMLVSDDAGATFHRSESAMTNGVVTALAASPAGNGSVVVAATTDGGALVSRDGGDTWTRAGTIVKSDRIQALIASPNYSRDQTLWASAWHTGAYRSTDGGTTWTSTRQGLTNDEQADRIHAPQFGPLSYAVEASGDSTLYLSGFDGLFAWKEPAQRWAEIQTQTEYIVGLAVSPDYARDGTVVVSTYVKGVFVSRDHGASFVPKDNGLGYPLSEGNKVLPIRRMHNVVFSPAYATDHTIFTATWVRFVKSTDGGETWKEILVAKVPPKENLRQFVIGVSPEYARDRTIYLGTLQGDVYMSTQQGDAGSWKTISNVGARVRSIAFSNDFDTDHTMFVSTEKGVLESTDAGKSWKRTGPAGISLLAISPTFSRDGTVFAGTAHGLFVSRDSARSWTQLEGGLPAGASIAAIAVSPAFGNDQTMLVSVAGTGLFRSTNAGRSFSPTGTSLASQGIIVTDFDRPTSEPLQFSPDYAQDKTVYAYAQENLLRSTDGGSTWQVLAVPSAADFRPSWTNGVVTSNSSSTDGSNNGKVLLAIGGVIVLAVIVGALVLRRRKRLPPPGVSHAQQG